MKTIKLGIAKLAIALLWGGRDREFKSHYSDQGINCNVAIDAFFFILKKKATIKVAFKFYSVT